MENVINRQVIYVIHYDTITFMFSLYTSKLPWNTTAVME